MEYSDPNGEVLSAATRVPLHPAGLYLGIKPEGWAASKSGVRVQVVALDPRGKPLAGARGQRRRLRAQGLLEPPAPAGRLLRLRFDHGDEAHRLRLLGHDRRARASVLLGEAREPRARSSCSRARRTMAGAKPTSNTSVWVRGDDDWWFEPDEPRPHRSDPGEEALRAGRDREIPGAHAVPRGDGARHRRARRRARAAGRRARRQIAGDRSAHGRQLRAERVRVRAGGARARRSRGAGPVRLAEARCSTASATGWASWTRCRSSAIRVRPRSSI